MRPSDQVLLCVLSLPASQVQTARLSELHTVRLPLLIRHNHVTDVPVLAAKQNKRLLAFAAPSAKAVCRRRSKSDPRSNAIHDDLWDGRKTGAIWV